MLRMPCLEHPIIAHQPSLMYEGEVTQEGTAKLICPENHIITAFIETPLYKVDMIKSYFAYTNGYYLESFMSLYQALENFRRSVIEVVEMKNHNLKDQGFSEEYFNNLNSFLEDSLDNSTFLYGAFKALYFTEFDKTIDERNSELQLRYKNFSLVSFRNKIVHAGAWPTQGDVQKAGNILVKYFSQIESELKTKVSSINIDTHERRTLEASSLMWFHKEYINYKIYNYTKKRPKAKITTFDDPKLGFIDDMLDAKLKPNSKPFEELIADFKKMNFTQKNNIGMYISPLK